MTSKINAENLKIPIGWSLRGFLWYPKRVTLVKPGPTRQLLQYRGSQVHMLVNGKIHSIDRELQESFLDWGDRKGSRIRLCRLWGTSVRIYSLAQFMFIFSSGYICNECIANQLTAGAWPGVIYVLNPTGSTVNSGRASRVTFLQKSSPDHARHSHALCHTCPLSSFINPFPLLTCEDPRK